MISCYNRQSNIPYNEKSTSCITPLKVVPDEALLQWDTKGLQEAADFLSKEADVTLK
jgi:hypothetical protein